jgi:formate dehydrogenase subunit gamma
MINDAPLNRFTLAERVVHWVVGVTFVLLVLSGLALSYPSLFWMAGLLGGGPATRVLHPWIGLVFEAALALMFFLWLKQMYFTRADLEWIRAIKHYARHDREKIPPSGKYNGGQKGLFWTQAVLAVVFLVTGLPLWLPEPFGAGFLNLIRLLHFLAALAGGLLLTLHIYLGTVANPGTARAMLTGTVTRDWAELHHPMWNAEQVDD